MHTVLVVGLVGCRAEPQVVVQLLGDGLHLQVLLACPEELPRKAGGSTDAHLEGPAQQSAIHKLLQGLHLSAQSVEGVLEAEPGIEAEDASVALDGLLHTASFADGTCHGLLAQDVLACVGSLYGHDAMPV